MIAGLFREFVSEQQLGFLPRKSCREIDLQRIRDCENLDNSVITRVLLATFMTRSTWMKDFWRWWLDIYTNTKLKPTYALGLLSDSMKHVVPARWLDWEFFRLWHWHQAKIMIIKANIPWLNVRLQKHEDALQSTLKKIRYLLSTRASEVYYGRLLYFFSTCPTSKMCVVAGKERVIAEVWSRSLA